MQESLFAKIRITVTRLVMRHVVQHASMLLKIKQDSDELQKSDICKGMDKTLLL